MPKATVVKKCELSQYELDTITNLLPWGQRSDFFRLLNYFKDLIQEAYDMGLSDGKDS